MKPIHKFNNGIGATLCHNCRVIINVGFSEKLYCENCIKIKETTEQKLYTEDTINIIMSNLRPIKLPSDKEIIKVASQETDNINEQIIFNNGAVYVCKLIEEQILNK